MNSYGIVDALTTDFSDYLNGEGNYSTAAYSGTVPFEPIENNPLPLDAQEEMRTISGIRISLYEQPEDVLLQTGASVSQDWNQAYEMQLFMKVGREGDYDYIVEQELMEFKDLAYEWHKDSNFNVGNITSVSGEADQLYTFEWVNVSQITREAFFSELRIQWAAYRSQI